MDRVENVIESRRPAKWDNSFVDEGHQLAREGLSDHEIAGVLGVPKSVFKRWRSQKKEFRLAIERGRAGMDLHPPTKRGKRGAGPRRGEELLDPADKPVTDQEKRFIEEYLLDLNIGEASIRSGLSHPNSGSILLRRPHIQKELSKELARRRERTMISADRVLREIACVAFADLESIFCPTTGNLQRPAEMKEEDRRAISSIKVVTKNGKQNDSVEFVHEIKLYDKLKALEMLMKHLGLFEPTKIDLKTDSNIIVDLVMRMEGRDDQSTVDGDVITQEAERIALEAAQ